MKLSKIAIGVTSCFVALTGNINVDQKSNELAFIFGISKAHAACRETATGVACDRPGGGGGGWNWWDTDEDSWGDWGENSGGGGSEGGNKPESSPDEEAPTAEISPADAASTVVMAKQLMNALKDLLETPGLNKTQIARMRALYNKLNDILTAASAGPEALHKLFTGDKSGAFEDVINFAVSYAVGFGVAASGAPVIIVVIASASAGYLFDNRHDVWNHLEATFVEFKHTYSNPPPPSNICGQFIPTCNIFLPPIVLDLDGDGIELLTKKKSRARIDIDDDGYFEKVSWVKSDDAIFVIDHNSSGTIDSLKEFSFSAFAPFGSTDLDGLRTFDTNLDGKFDNKDEAFKKSGVWLDKNQNAFFDEGEFLSSEQIGLEFISLIGEEVYENRDDSVIVTSMTYNLLSDSGHSVTRKAGDILFAGDTRSGVRTVYDYNSIQILENEKSGRLLKLLSHSSNNVKLGKEEFDSFDEYEHVIAGKHDDIIYNETDRAMTIRLKNGDDIAYGNSRRDVFKGGKGRDKLFGKGGNDFLSGGKGSDLLVGGRGDDVLKGGSGADRFKVGKGHDLVLDFDIGHDQLLLTKRFSGLPLTSYYAIEEEGNTTVYFSENDSVTFKGLALSDLKNIDFK